jgi:thiol-disulfide isomerase/thioredoxin
MRMLRVLTPFVVVLAAGWSVAAAQKPAPEVALRGPDGAAVRLSDYRGRVLLVDFWASWCVPCKASFPALDAIYREYQPRGLEVLAVNVDEEQRNADAFLAAHPHRMAVLFDPKGIGPEAFGVKGMPTSFLIDKTGAIRFTHTGYAGSVDVSYRKEIAQLLAEQ